jgi:anaerobic ribonucleoside-triphosphate reductase activating protein
MNFRLHAMEAASRANGPGLRAVIWFQGCTIGCPGCFNPETHAISGGECADTHEVFRRLSSGSEQIEGVSISGGEPFQQPEALLDLAARFSSAGLSVLVFSGYTLHAIRGLPLGPEILRNIDVLIAGPYVESSHWGRALLGSANQSIHLLTSRYTHRDFEDVPSREVIIHRDGTVTLSGINPLRWGRWASGSSTGS